MAFGIARLLKSCVILYSAFLAACVGAVFDVVPIAFPLFAPGHGPAAGGAGFAGEGLFVAVEGAGHAGVLCRDGSYGLRDWYSAGGGKYRVWVTFAVASQVTVCGG